MVDIKIHSFLAFVFSLAAATYAEESCPGVSVGLDKGTCETIEQVGDVIQQVFLANHQVDVVDIKEEDIKADTDSDVVSYLKAEADNGVSYTIVHTSEASRRRLADDGDLPEFLKIDGGRNLLTCSGTANSCTAWWCCMFCGWWCRRRHLSFLENIEEEMEGEVMDMDDLCHFLQTTGSHVFDGTCLEGASVSCTAEDGDHLEVEDKEGTDVASAMVLTPEEDSSGGSVRHYSVLGLLSLILV
mmetsp:Transcript_10637/g.18692  ORF Transcript_10637/g.18692 Transcript_10637/m.18692 type:complete len:243 (+) Transcript_10637:47-775(+)|eukprot:CAMPEP_0183724554 /NCGR_PEP_ID=MMETSP0737-20130205/18004_1 /TAXON_ID=385413 /ORGANISM="Thalassiosira miniscula, Strain CCMP1093" /LENGTH=242 /DNA_ID=CAMNT_0025955167 /DNA_START=49 /DNA_END=777 /DNA_ORIENTATION=-